MTSVFSYNEGKDSIFGLLSPLLHYYYSVHLFLSINKHSQIWKQRIYLTG